MLINVEELGQGLDQQKGLAVWTKTAGSPPPPRRCFCGTFFLCEPCLLSFCESTIRHRGHLGVRRLRPKERVNLTSARRVHQ